MAQGQFSEFTRAIAALIAAGVLTPALGWAQGEVTEATSAAGVTTPADAAALREIEQFLGSRQATPQSPDLSPPAAKTAVPRLMDLSLDMLLAAGGSSAESQDVPELQAGGHDPIQNGFTVQNLELSAFGVVDPYLAAEAHLVFQLDAEGETIVELEEAFASTQSLPYGLQVKAGTFYTEFGRLNPKHPHAWTFVDSPIVNTRLLGADGMRNPGVRLSWLTPLPWYSEWLLTVQNAKGETASSFLGGAEETEFAGHALVSHDVKSLLDLLHSARWLNSFSLTDTWTLNAGASVAAGPNPTGPDNTTLLAGADLYAKWLPLSANKGWPFVALQAEAMQRRYEAGGVRTPRVTLVDRGGYAQALWGFAPRFAAGLRGEIAGGGTNTAGDPQRDHRVRFSPNVTWFPSEFSKVRLQYNNDNSETLGRAHSAWLQFEFMLGAHPAHTF